ncbi:MAG TPA: NifB/NifX family molybdenum-iron cluster-binding protein [Candidatus Kryptonia bacterium]
MNRRLAVAIEESSSEERVAQHFGHCAKFNICELDSENKIVKQESYFNPLNGEHGGACQLPAYVKQFNVDTIIAGGMGRKAVMGFQQAGIEVITAPGLLFSEALKLFTEGKLSGYEECAGHEHHS